MKNMISAASCTKWVLEACAKCIMEACVLSVQFPHKTVDGIGDGVSTPIPDIIFRQKSGIHASSQAWPSRKAQFIQLRCKSKYPPVFRLQNTLNELRFLIPCLTWCRRSGARPKDHTGRDINDGQMSCSHSRWCAVMPCAAASRFAHCWWYR